MGYLYFGTNGLSSDRSAGCSHLRTMAGSRQGWHITRRGVGRLPTRGLFEVKFDFGGR